jgi:hypothetical protein
MSSSNYCNSSMSDKLRPKRVKIEVPLDREAQITK